MAAHDHLFEPLRGKSRGGNRAHAEPTPAQQTCDTNFYCVCADTRVTDVHAWRGSPIQQLLAMFNCQRQLRRAARAQLTTLGIAGAYLMLAQATQPVEGTSGARRNRRLQLANDVG